MSEDSAPKPRRIGRERGVPNRVSASAKENIVAVFVRMGSTAGMYAWAQEHPVEFYRIYARLLPTEIKATVTLPIKVVFRDPTQRPAGYGRKSISRD